MAKTVRFLHHVTLFGAGYRPGDVAVFGDEFADRLIGAYLAIDPAAPPPPETLPDPLPQYLLDADLTTPGAPLYAAFSTAAPAAVAAAQSATAAELSAQRAETASAAATGLVGAYTVNANGTVTLTFSDAAAAPPPSGTGYTVTDGNNGTLTYAGVTVTDGNDGSLVFGGTVTDNTTGTLAFAA